MDDFLKKMENLGKKKSRTNIFKFELELNMLDNGEEWSYLKKTILE
jgi:hypothetical protein